MPLSWKAVQGEKVQRHQGLVDELDVPGTKRNYITVKPGPAALTKALAKEQSVIVEQKIRREIRKPSGELTQADLLKVTELDLIRNNKITDAGLKELTELQLLEVLLLRDTKVTKAGVAQLQKVLPKCKIDSNPTK